MSNSFLTWLVVASVAALGLFLFFGLTPVDPSAEGTDTAAVVSSVGDESSATTYWQPVTSPSVASSNAYVVSTSTTPCTACGAQSSILPAASTAPVMLVGGCGQPAGACQATPCPSLSCSSSCSNQPVCGERPRINRNMPLCVNECGFLQLHSTVPQPTCQQLRYEWTASKGQFLDPSSPEPLYYAPTTYFPGGEDVWIGLTITDAQGIRYTDQVQLHVNNVK